MAVVLALLGCLLLLCTACSGGAEQFAPGAPAGADQQTVEPSSGTTTPEPKALPRSEPTRIDIPRIDAHSTLVPLGLNPDKTIQVPPVSQPMQAGWYLNGPTPGERGPAVVLGHVDGDRKEGIFFNLKEMRTGDEVDIARREGTSARFVVTKVDRVAKTQFPTDAVYGDTPDAQLRLITCGGTFDHAAHSYLDNIIVYATLR